MPSSNPHGDALRIQLMMRGEQSAQELARALGVSQPTISRHLVALAPLIEPIGQARARRYSLRRPLRAAGSEWPIYRVEPSGQVNLFGLLRCLHGGFRVEFAATPPVWIPSDFARNGVFPGLPFFLQDVRPQGFLGRAIAHTDADTLMLPRDVQNWSDDDTLVYFLSRGHDLPGAFVVGDSMAQRVTPEAVAPRAIAAEERSAAYPTFAAQAERGEAVGSSAGGEQPKFATTVRNPDGTAASVLVKFTTAEPSAIRERWSDLLVCEHLALETARTALGVATSATSLHDFAGRRFLEVTRFDRVGTTGRRGVLSLGAILDANGFEAPNENWADAAVAMARAGVLREADADAVQRIAFFGQCIANNDMHRGNLSFLPDDTGPFTVAPLYDMLPMAYAPTRQGSLPSEIVRPPAAAPRFRENWERSFAAAQLFWAAVAEHPQVSDGFRRIASATLAAME